MAFDFGTANDMQKEAIKTTEGPLLIIAGPGTGKTHTLVQRIVYLIQEKDVKPEEIMVATFTEKAAKELITRITNELLKKNIKANLNEMYVGTFHSICLRIIKEHLEFTNLKKNYRMLDGFDQTYLINSNYYKFKAIEGFDSIGLEAEKWNNSTWKQCGKLGGYISSLSEELVDIDALSKDSDIRFRALAESWKLYNAITLEENLVDFSTIQTECYRLLVNNQDILAELQEKIKYIMIDEYQDTNYIQERLVFLIAGEKQNICVVGDDDQGLYRFRGATIRNILEFPKNFPNGCKQINLVENYRSEKGIIDFYNEWMQNTSGSWGSFDWGEFRFPKVIKGSKQNIYTGTTVITCSAKKSYDDWHKNVYEFIKTMKDSGKLTDYNQIAFLCRSVTNDKVVDLINYLEDNGINVYSPRSEIYFERLEIRQLIGCMLLCFPAYEKRMRAKTFDYNPEKLFEYFEEKCLPEAELMTEEYPDTLGKFISDVRKKHANLKENTDYAFTGLLYQLLEFEPFSSLVDISIGSGVIDERPARNLSIFSGLLGKFEYIERLEVFSPEKIEHATTEFFTKFLRVMIENGIDEYEDDSEYAPKGCVSFMTIHQSKGMEFPVVIVGSMNQKPGSDKENIMNEVAERYFKRKPFEDKVNIPNYDFWRLYYTAFSRAQNLLVLSGNEMGGSWACPSKYFADMYNKLPDWKSVDVANIDFELVKPVNIKETYSFTSHIAVYENCALQYKYFKELGFTQVRIGSTLFGTLVHETIEDVHRAAMRHEEYTITPENVRSWLDTNYQTLSKSEHAYLGAKQVDAAYNQVMRYIERATSGVGGGIVWSHIQEAEVEVSLVKEDYILKGQIDLIRGNGDTVEIVDFKSEKVPEMDDEMLNRYRRQLEIYAYLVEQRDHKKVTKMHLYYTGEDKKSPMVSFTKSDDSIDVTIKEFDAVVAKIQNRDFSQKACNKKLCRECDFRYHCGEVKKK